MMTRCGQLIQFKARPCGGVEYGVFRSLRMLFSRKERHSYAPTLPTRLRSETATFVSSLSTFILLASNSVAFLSVSDPSASESAADRVSSHLPLWNF